PPLTPASTSKDPGNYCGNPPRTCRTAAGALHRGRFTLDGPFDFGIAEPGDRPNAHSLSVALTDVSAHVPTELDPSVICDRGAGHALGAASGCTDGGARRRGKNVTNRGAPADHCQDRWCPAVRRRTDQSHS